MKITSSKIKVSNFVPFSVTITFESVDDVDDFIKVLDDGNFIDTTYIKECGPQNKVEQFIQTIMNERGE